MVNPMGTANGLSQIGLQALARGKAANNGGVLRGSLQALPVHVPLAAPSGAGRMAQPGADRQEGGVATRETAHRPGTADLPASRIYFSIGIFNSSISPSDKRDSILSYYRFGGGKQDQGLLRIPGV